MSGMGRRVMKGLAANAVHYSGLRRAMCALRRRQSGGRRITIVSYHRVVEDFAGEATRSIPGLLISQDTFRRHLEEAHASGYAFASLGEALDVMAGRKSTKRDLFVVTFDDGYRDVYRHAAPVLQQMGVPAITYLPVGLIGTQRRFQHDRLFHLLLVSRVRGVRPLYELLHPAAASLLAPIASGKMTVSAALDEFIERHPAAVLAEVIDGLTAQMGGGPELLPPQGDVMSWDEVRQLSHQGFDFGAHTVGHTVLTLEDQVVVDHEIRVSKEKIEHEIGRPVRDFAYCNGWYSDVVIASLVKHGFRSAVTTEDLPNEIGGDPFALRRKVLWENFSVGLLGDYSTALTTCQLDDVFGMLKLSHPVLGRRTHRLAAEGA